jgi:integrase
MAIIPRTRPDGTTYYQVRLRDLNGDWYGEKFTGSGAKTAAEAYERAERSKKDHGQPTGPSGQRTFADIAAEWLASNGNKAELSLAKDEMNLRVHINPWPLPPSEAGRRRKTLGETRIGEITKKDINDLVLSWWPPAFANETTRRMFGTLRAVFTYAVDNLYLIVPNRIDPCHKINLPPRKPRKTPIPFTTPTARRERPRIDLARLRGLAEALGPYECMVHLGLNGRRWGEAAGLRVGDINFGYEDDLTIITVNRQLTRNKRGGMVLKDEVKSEHQKAEEDKGPIAFAVGPWLSDKLWDHIGVRGTDPGAFVFTTPDPAWVTNPRAQCRRWNRQNVMLHYSNWRDDFWLPSTEATGFGGLQFKDLRKIATQLLVEGNVGSKTRERRLGNTIDVQNNVYLQATDPDDWRAADFIDGLLSQAEGHD